MKQWILENVVTLITTLLGGSSFFAYIAERKKRIIDEEVTTIAATEQMRNLYNNLSSDMSLKYTELHDEIVNLKNVVKSLTVQLDEEKLKNIKLQKSYDDLKSTHEKLKKEFESYTTSK